jgi:hypothetical protein
MGIGKIGYAIFSAFRCGLVPFAAMVSEYFCHHAVIKFLVYSFDFKKDGA